MQVYIYIYMYIYIYIYLYIHTHVKSHDLDSELVWLTLVPETRKAACGSVVCYTCIYIDIQAHISVYTYICIYIYIHGNPLQPLRDCGAVPHLSSETAYLIADSV